MCVQLQLDLNRRAVIKLQQLTTIRAPSSDTLTCAMTLRVSVRDDNTVHPIQKVVRLLIQPLTLSLVTVNTIEYRQVNEGVFRQKIIGCLL